MILNHPFYETPAPFILKSHDPPLVADTHFVIHFQIIFFFSGKVMLTLISVNFKGHRARLDRAVGGPRPKAIWN